MREARSRCSGASRRSSSIQCCEFHCLQLWWNLRDLAMEEELHERPLYREFAGFAGVPRFPNETNILRFGHLLKKHKLAHKAVELINTGWKH